jgi:hypothetical protein
VSHSESHTDTGITTAFYQGYEAGERNERERIIGLIDRYKNKPAFTFANLTSLIKGENK